jgi:glyoxylase-like metal-dependent hydrolase (beta-lactamase superfamily II)
MVMKFTPPIRIELPTPFAVGPVNAYLFTEPEPVLVDTGVQSAESLAALTEGLAEQGLTPADLQRIVITHPHEDHCGQAGVLLEQSQAELWIWEKGVDWLLNFPTLLQERIDYYQVTFLPRTGMAPAMRQVVLGYFQEMIETYAPIPAGRVHTFGLNDTLTMGGLAWQILHMPGHAHHQTCFYQPDSRQFISADMLLHRTPTPVLEHPLPGQARVPGLPLFLQSLDVVEALAIDAVYPGHGPIFHDPLHKSAQQRKRIQRRKKQCLQAIEDGYQTLIELTNHLYANRDPGLRFAGLWMIVGYLDLLQAEGKVQEALVDGMWRYSTIK